MADWLNKWQRWFHKPAMATENPPLPDPGFWNLNRPQPLVWDSGELDLLRDCESHTTLCSATEETTGEVMQTVVLGFERGTQRVLLDEFFPARSRVLPGQKFQLSLPSRAGVLILEVIVRDSIWVARNPAYVAEILAKKHLRDRRVQSRVAFAGTAAPKVDLLLPLTPAMRGQLVDLSPKGCAIACLSPQKPQLFSRRGQCRIHFSDTFVLAADIQVTQANFQRQPCRHTLFRARFLALPVAGQEQLLAFIHSYETLAGAAQTQIH